MSDRPTTRDDAVTLATVTELARQMDGPRRWYAVENDLLGGGAVGNRDRSVATYDYRRGDIVIADFMEQADAIAIAALLNLHGYLPKRWLPLAAAPDAGAEEVG